jgi:hypothetical protein
LFTNREIAIAFWIVALIIFIIINKGSRKEFKNLLKILFSKIFLIVFSIMAVYISGIVLGLYKLGFWDFTLLKDTLVWTIFTAIALLLNSNDNALQEGFFRSKVVENVKIIVLIQFIANTYTFNLIAEIILVFALVFLGAMQALAGTDQKYKSVEKLTTVLITILGLTIMANAVYFVVKEWGTFSSIKTLRSFLIPILLTTLYLPFVYIMALYSIYEKINVRLKMKSYIDKRLRSFIMRRIFLKYNFKLKSLRKFQAFNLNNILKSKSKSEANQIINSL